MPSLLDIVISGLGVGLLTSFGAGIAKAIALLELVEPCPVQIPLVERVIAYLSFGI